jgi:hypothetical protein
VARGESPGRTGLSSPFPPLSPPFPPFPPALRPRALQTVAKVLHTAFWRRAGGRERRGGEGGSRCPTAGAVGHIITPAARADLFSELAAQDTKLSQACPNYVRTRRAGRAASPLAVRKGCAFP